jgi:asparagine synthase (glutamine-hydrolysing)
MCGICGKLDFGGRDIPEGLIRRMNAALAHRGPDDEGIHVHNGFSGSGPHGVSVGLGHKRLSIIDLSKAGRQPMANESKTVWIVFNGEIYGFDKLKKELERRGHRFSSNTDSEVVIHLYEEEGIQCLEKLNGMFAFALWDSRCQTLYLVRDRLGIKPLVYFWDGASLIFASEIKSVLQDPGISKEMDRNALDLYLTFNYIPAPHTIFKNIRKLPPGYYLAARNRHVETHRYWDVTNDPSRDQAEGADIDACKKKIHELLEDAVRMQLTADVPLGAFLSGGIDSSIIVGLMSKVSTRPVQTYTIGYQDMPMFDETGYARAVAEFNRTDHHEIMVSSRDLRDVIPEVLTSLDEPFADSSALPTYVVSRETKKHVTVARSGDGGDELFAGYRLYSGEYWYSRYKRVPRLLRKRIVEPFLKALPDSRDTHVLEYLRRMKKFVLGAEDRFEDRFFSWNEIFHQGLRDRILRQEQGCETGDMRSGKSMVLERLNSFKSDTINRMLYTDLKISLPNDMLAKVDLMSMKNSLEVRVPFLDHRLVEYVFRLPGRLKLPGKKGKFILLEAFKYLLPPALLKRPKRGFEIPIGRWLKSDLHFLIREYLSRERIEKQGIFNFGPIEGLIEDLVSNRADTSWHLWNLIVFQDWHSRYFGY